MARRIFFSDLAGIGQGFRDSNAWLAALSQQSLPAAFYAGDAWGSFNAWMRDEKARLNDMLRAKMVEDKPGRNVG